MSSIEHESMFPTIYTIQSHPIATLCLCVAQRVCVHHFACVCVCTSHNVCFICGVRSGSQTATKALARSHYRDSGFPARRDGELRTGTLRKRRANNQRRRALATAPAEKGQQFSEREHFSNWNCKQV